jgi:hypothetical protein
MTVGAAHKVKVPMSLGKTKCPGMEVVKNWHSRSLFSPLSFLDFYRDTL